MPTETVIVVGSTGNIGVSAVIGALRANFAVLAVVRNAASAEKLFHHVGTREGITTVEADITSETAMLEIVDKVRQGELPAFQHVYSTAGGLYGATPLHELSLEELRLNMSVNFETNFLAYRATIPYLLSQSNPATFTLCIGAQGDLGQRAAPALTQGALYSLANVACRDLQSTNVRFNEVYLGLRVEVDESAAQTGFFKASSFAEVYVKILSSPEVRSMRVTVTEEEDLARLRTKVKWFDLQLKKAS